MDKTVGIIGLGKMGANVARRLVKQGWKVTAYNRTESVTRELEKEGIIGAYSFEDLVKKLPSPKVILSILPSGPATNETITTLLPLLSSKDIIIDGANGFYKDAQKNAQKAQEKEIRFIDVGISGGPGGALNGACLMVGGDKDLFTYLNPLFAAMAQPGAIMHFQGVGAGHFVKMVHNGIEYGIMQALAEGFAILKDSDYRPNLQDVTEIYNNGSVVESRLVTFLQQAFEKYGNDLDAISGSVGFNGEGEWTAKVGKEMGVPTPVIEDSVKFRKDSQKKPSYTGKLLTGMRNQFGGHSTEPGKMT